MNYNEMIAYIDDPDNGFVQEKTINNITYRVSYRPTELLIAQETRTKQNMLSDEIHELFEKYNNQHYFVFSISKGTSEVQYSSANQNEYAQLINKLNFNLHETIFLTSSAGDTLNLINYHFTPTYGLTQSTDLLFFFEKEQEKVEYLQFNIKELGLYTGNTKFRFKRKALYSKRLKNQHPNSKN
ncbi:MAG TPA: hypothetical protein DDX98_03465 [Bacteroidales bacterium]|nr:hypothetical protein [Bacteroidales bacterium]